MELIPAEVWERLLEYPVLFILVYVIWIMNKVINRLIDRLNEE